MVDPALAAPPCRVFNNNYFNNNNLAFSERNRRSDDEPIISILGPRPAYDIVINVNKVNKVILL